MSEPDDPRWLADLSPELRKEVAVRPAWRSRLIDEVARARRPIPGGDYDDRHDELADDAVAAERARDRRLVIRPLTAAAAALTFAVLGAGATITVLSWRARTAAESTASIANPPVVTAIPVANREVVRFELAAPKASRVALVGSFNEWNPVATPLTRDASGRWVVALHLPPGRHVYAFVVDGDVTADPDAPRAADDDFGSPNSVILVGRS
jgi:hypothetical protein